MSKSTIALAAEVEATYRRYLQTTFYFRDPQLRRSFEEALSSGDLCKGPYIEATPVFKLGETPRKLFAEIAPSVEADAGFLQAAQGDRPLYQHQEQAIRAVSAGQNVIVATGTGSGKTECFLYPILLHLYQEFRAGELCPGVRALVLYPMNALANDQRERLGAISKTLEDAGSPFRFTFGQYTGQAPEDASDTRRNAANHLANRMSGELVLREEMRRTPPHILLTNYSMLEYLLLRPHDSPLFDNGNAQWWTFLVLDEAHQYRGSKGAEMGMLLRRLKRRLREGGRAGPFRCVATGATLVGGREDVDDVSRFAADLFGEPFDSKNAILGESEPLAEPPPRSLSDADYRRAADMFAQGSNSKPDLVELAGKLGIAPSGESDPAKMLGEIFLHDGRSTQLRLLLNEHPAEVAETANAVFADIPSDARVDALACLTQLLLRAQSSVSGAPLLSVRYHLFLRSLEGAFVVYGPEEGQRRAQIGHRQQDSDFTQFEVALCRECGQHYIVGMKRDGKLTEAIRDPSHPDFGATFFRPLNEDGGHHSATSTAGKVYRLCTRCGRMWKENGKPACSGCTTSVVILVEEQQSAAEKEDQIPRCSACGYTSPDPVREVIHGSDAPHSVIATALFRMLPEDRQKVLAFADGRQEAAFFAWYLEHSFKDILMRNLIASTVADLGSLTDDGLSLSELAAGLHDLFRKQKMFPATVGDLELRKCAWVAVYREFLTDEPRISLEGTGLVRWSTKWPEWFRAPGFLLDPPWSLTEPEARDLLFVLLDYMRSDRAVELHFEGGAPFNWDDLGLQARQMRVRIGPPMKQKDVRSWDGKTGRRARFLAKLLVTKGVPQDEALEKAVGALRHIWQDISECDDMAPSSVEGMLLLAGDARRLNPAWWRVRHVTDEDTVFQCETCSRLQSVSVLGVCPRHGCNGTLQALRRRDLLPNHYRQLYETHLPGSLRVEEHTAQLSHDKAREFQDDFKKGAIHVLSCSTTFEVGVDLGDLDTIFLRNVPPEPFNYAQRVGRAGRRSGHPGFAITYCRRGPHDLYHFAHPERMLQGMVRPPVLSLTNEKIIIRHMTAMSLSAFFRANRARFTDVDSLLGDMARPSALVDFRSFLHNEEAKLAESMIAIVPTDIASHVGLTDDSWIWQIAGNESRLAMAEAAVSQDHQNVRKVEEDAASEGRYRAAEWAKRRARTICKEDVLSFLSRNAVIPKYGFPVDVVELDLQRVHQSRDAMNVLLQRDLALAIAEFAPTCEVVANKKKWSSYGLKIVADRELARWWYAKCRVHNRFERIQWRGDEVRPTFETCCPSMEVGMKYVDPVFGFIADRTKPPTEPKRKPARVFSTRPYFAGFKDGGPEAVAHGPVSVRPACPGCMVVLCEGRRGGGFYVCKTCGAGFRGDALKKNHKTPFGQECHGTLEQVALGHEFTTDVLELQFNVPLQEDTSPVWFAHSLAYALVEGAAERLEVPSTDLNVTVGKCEQLIVPPVILYDNVPGGAGLVARLEDKTVLKECLTIARERVGGACGCDEDTSCYGCLRNYRNQFAHPQLQRGPVLRYINAIMTLL
ncbi:MAG: DEAD/DEAH box helicase [Planctomycetes bacterium]|nr:DEAD/DEAH box helicase [Planctomycetota bacterium]